MFKKINNVVVLLAVIAMCAGTSMGITQFDIRFEESNPGTQALENGPIPGAVNTLPTFTTDDIPGSVLMRVQNTYTDSGTGYVFGNNHVLVLEDTSIVNAGAVETDSHQADLELDFSKNDRMLASFDMMVDSKFPNDPNGPRGNIFAGVSTFLMEGKFELKMQTNGPDAYHGKLLIAKPLAADYDLGTFPLGVKCHIDLIFDFDAGTAGEVTVLCDGDDRGTYPMRSTGGDYISKFGLNSGTTAVVKAAFDNIIFRNYPDNCTEVGKFMELLTGDINKDCKVNFVDVKGLAANWLSCNSPAGCP